jgi:hypothetical protein
LNKKFLDAAKGSFSDYVQVYYFMTGMSRVCVRFLGAVCVCGACGGDLCYRVDKFHLVTGIVSKMLLYFLAHVGPVKVAATPDTFVSGFFCVKVAAPLERLNLVAKLSLSHTHAPFHNPHLRHFHSDLRACMLFLRCSVQEYTKHEAY